jgi:hypothetical protein
MNILPSVSQRHQIACALINHLKDYDAHNVRIDGKHGPRATKIKGVINFDALIDAVLIETDNVMKQG